LNPILAIPWILGSPITISIAYFATKIGLMPRTTGVAVPWTMPLGISGTLATNSIMGGSSANSGICCNGAFMDTVYTVFPKAV